jgi:nitrogen PTS system EIIA component
MRIAEFLNPDAIVPRLGSTDKVGILNELCVPLARRVPEISQERFVSILLDREKLDSTGIGEGVAIPHGKIAGLASVVASFGVSVPGVDFKAKDGKPTHLFFTLVAPENSAGMHLRALARVSRLFKNQAFRRQIIDTPDAKGIFDLIAAEDEKG